MTRLFHRPGPDAARSQDHFDPIREGERYGLPPDTALAIWQRVSEEATDVAGRRDEMRARFHALAARWATHGRRRSAAPGRRTRVGTESDREAAGPGAGDERVPAVPGRRTAVDVRAWADAAGESTRLERPRAGAADAASARAPSRAWNRLIKPGGPSYVSRDLAAVGSAPEVGDLGEAESALVEHEHGGAPLPADVAARMRALLGRDFSHVRIHTDAAAARAAAVLRARAFTLGQHIYFDRDQFDPDSPAGERLLVHELTHVVQHDDGRLPRITGELQVSDPSSATEREARAAEDLAGRPSPIAIFRGPVLTPQAPSTTSRPGSGVIQRSPQDPPDGASARVAFVREEGLNLRAGPDQRAASLRQMTFGQRVHVLDDAKGDWLKIAVLGQTGYAYRPRIHAPPKELIAKDPGLTLIKVKPHQTFWGLVKDRYGISGNESSKDQNINHFINAIRAVNKPEAFVVKTDVLDDVGNAAISGRDASDTELIAGVDLWIPSFGVASKMDVGSGTVRGEVSRYVKKFEQKLDDFRAAARAAGKFIPAALLRNAGDMATGLLQGLIDFALDAAKILAVSTAVGALLGSLLGGVGAVPGAEIGFEIGLVILEYYGLYMLVEAVLTVAGNFVGQLGQFVALAWKANGDKAMIEQAGQALAEALGILGSALLVVVAAYLMKRGAQALSKTKFAQKIGETRLAKWLEERRNGATSKDPLGKEKAEREKAEREKAEREKAEREKADKESQEGGGGTKRDTGATPTPREGRLIVPEGRVLSAAEREIAERLVAEGRTVEALAESTSRTADYVVDGVRTELKSISNISSPDPSGALARRILDGAGQAAHIIADVRRQAGMTLDLAQRATRRAFGADRAARIQSVRLIGSGFDVTVPRVTPGAP